MNVETALYATIGFLTAFPLTYRHVKRNPAIEGGTADYRGTTPGGTLEIKR
jgi:hypothetical protein